MNTNRQTDEQRMMDEEYSRDFGGCLWGFIACLLAVAAICFIILLTT